ncbi:hypothetical protein EJ913_17955 [Azospirillum doebereinerae]|uniref:Uncharacterized protein n=1 Tax=Azospirillum doebereinerae TaxID=92933 RepID=A0A3S0VH38_9PROT|nr:hypothetical protein EJ913_17955 [Azospirillum doebereinerae]
MMQDISSVDDPHSNVPRNGSHGQQPELANACAGRIFSDSHGRDDPPNSQATPMIFRSAAFIGATPFPDDARNLTRLVKDTNHTIPQHPSMRAEQEQRSVSFIAAFFAVAVRGGAVSDAPLMPNLSQDFPSPVVK